jgi:hypothetical protein
MKITLVGVCQVVGMAEALRVLLPKATVNAYHVRPETQGLEAIVAQLPSSDLVITQVLPSHNIPSLTIDRLKAMAIPRLLMIPPIAFDGFHPDIHILANFQSPIEVYQSRILAAAYALGVSESRAMNFFNQLVYSRLRYDSVFDASKDALAQTLRPWGFDVVLDRYFDSWMVNGAFMYTPNHPRIDVLASFARVAAERADLLDPTVPTPADIPDILAMQHRWAIYPEIAQKLGIAADMTFKRTLRGEMQEKDRALDLATFTHQSYDLFGRSNIEILRNDPVVKDTVHVIESMLV